MPTIQKKTIRPGERIRVLVVDDSVVVRRLLTETLDQDPRIEVVGTASNGMIALQRIPQVSPDIITLDVEMPDMDGLETLRRVRAEYPRIHSVMLSSLTERGAAVTLDALTLGAGDYVSKPAGAGSLAQSITSLREELLPKIKQFFQFEGDEFPAVPSARIPPKSTLFRPNIQRRIVAIGVSTGGPTALADIMPMFPAGFPLPVLIVQHMPPLFTRMLADRLQSLTSLRVEEAAEGSPLAPGKILIAPGDFHMRVRGQAGSAYVSLDKGQPENSCRPAVDVTFRSVADVFGGSTIAVILTGMGQDGLRGVEILKAAGSYVITQDEASCVVWGMPKFVEQAGLSDAVVHLNRVVPEILKQL